MILDLFAGPGGWDEGLTMLGRDDVEGAEWDQDACLTAEAAGHARMQVDITTLDPKQFAQRAVEGLIASPSCQTFSPAGKSEGIASLDDLADAITATALDLETADPRTSLVLQPMRFIRDLLPAWIAFENVPQVLPVWLAYAETLRTLGYSVWCGILNSADWGVPQSRRRAILMASLHGHVTPPDPTHSRNGEWTLFGELPRWVTMAEALGWNEADCVAANQLAPESAIDASASLWPLTRPATTIVRSFRPDIVAAPGYRLPGDGPRQNTPGSLYVTPEQMCILQGIRTDYPFTAKGLTKRLSLIGAILPPPWAAAILAPLLNMPRGACVECGNDDPTENQRHCSDCLGALVA